MISIFEKAFLKLQQFLWGAITVSLLLMMCIIFLQVFTRYVIFYSLPWSEELSRYLFVFIILMGINIAVTQDKLIKIDAIQTVIKTVRGRAIVNLIHSLIGILACILISIHATDLFPVGMVQKSPAMRIPMIIMYIVVTLGYAISAIALFFKVYDNYKVITDPKTKGINVTFSDDIKSAMNKE